LIRFDAFTLDEKPNEAASKSACGASISSLIVFYVISLALVVGVRWLGRRSMLPSIPPADCCSQFISAACHAPPDEIDPCLGRVKWGVTTREVGEGYGHCSLSSQPVGKPQVGTVYY
jgi:hypothetical protein